MPLGAGEKIGSIVGRDKSDGCICRKCFDSPIENTFKLCKTTLRGQKKTVIRQTIEIVEKEFVRRQTYFFVESNNFCCWFVTWKK